MCCENGPFSKQHDASFSFARPGQARLLCVIGIEKGKPFAPDARMKKILANGACYPASSRAPAPFTITSVPGKMRASWPNSNGCFMSRRASSRGRLPCPSVVILDSQSVQTTERGGARGFDGHKRVKGRKRHLLVDTLGMVVARRVESRQCVGPTRGGAAARRLTIRLPEDPDGDGRCRLREPQVCARAKTASRVAT